MNIDWVLRSLSSEATLRIVSSEDLAATVNAKSREFALKDPAFLISKPTTPISIAVTAIETSPAQILHELGRATTFLDDSPFSSVARHWAHLRYCATLTGNTGIISLSKYGADVVHHHKTTQSEQLGIGLAIIVAKAYLSKLYPGWQFTAVDVDRALDTGFADGVQVNQAPGTKKRPDYFLIGRRAFGKKGALRVVVLECKGTHYDHNFMIEQLARASVQVQTVEIGDAKPTSLMVASRLTRNGVTAHILDPPGNDEPWELSRDDIDDLLSEDPGDQRWTPTMPRWEEHHEGALSNENDVSAVSETTVEDDWIPGAPLIYRIPSDGKNWFLRILARAAAASALAFAGNTSDANQYRTARQRGAEDSNGQLSISYPETTWRGSTTTTLEVSSGLRLEGTSYRMALPDRTHFEVFKGLESNLYRYLVENRPGPYLRAATRLGRRLPSKPTFSNGQLVISSHDGTFLVMRRV